MGGGGHHIGIGHGVHVLSARHQTGNVGHVHQQRSAVPVGDVGKGFEIQGSGIGRSPRHQHPGTIPAHDVLHPVVVNAPRFGLHPVADGPVYLSRLVHHRPVGQVAAAGEIHAHQGVPRLQQGHKGRQIGLGTGMGLHIGVLRAEELFHPVNGQPLDLVHILAPAVVPPAGVALGILVGQAAAHGGHHRGGGDVLRGDEFNILLLPGILPLQPHAHLRVLFPQAGHILYQQFLHAILPRLWFQPSMWGLSSPMKNTATVPFPAWEPMMVPMSHWTIFPLRFGSFSSMASVSSRASSGQLELQM